VAGNCLLGGAPLFRKKTKHMKNIIIILFWAVLFAAFNMHSTGAGKTVNQNTKVAVAAK